jgi:SAM-dependent methyltransferase
LFRNLVNLHDVVGFAEKIRGPRSVVHRLAPLSRVRIRAAWRHTDAPASGWWDIPEVRRRWNAMVTDSPDRTAVEYVLERYFIGRRDLRMLSLGCGTGEKELEWLESGRIRRMDGVDLSPERIAFASSRAVERGFSDKAFFRVADARRFAPQRGSVDLVLLDGALHHLAPVRPVLESVAQALAPGGLLVLIDFVGPSRFQWTDAQLEAVEGLLAKIPVENRRRWQDGRPKSRAYRPGRLSMWISDPSEAAQSSEILPALRERFDLLEVKDLGGTILHLLFKDIAHHYITPDAAAQRILTSAFEAEDRALRSGQLPSDFVFAVARPTDPTPGASRG